MDLQFHSRQTIEGRLCIKPLKKKAADTIVKIISFKKMFERAMKIKLEVLKVVMLLTHILVIFPMARDGNCEN